MPKAASLAEDIKTNFKLDSELVKLSGGVFEVYCDNKLIFSKKSEGRFPTKEEIVSTLTRNLKKP